MNACTHTLFFLPAHLHTYRHTQASYSPGLLYAASSDAPDQPVSAVQCCEPPHKQHIKHFFDCKRDYMF